MRILGLWTAVALAVTFASFSSQVIAEEIPVAAYGRLPNVAMLTISPDGEKLAFAIGTQRDERSIVISTIDGSVAPVRIPTNGEAPLGIVWFSNDRIGVYFKKFVSRAGGRFRGNETRLVSMSIDGKQQKQIVPAASVASPLRDDPDHVLMTSVVVKAKGSKGGGSAFAREGLLGLYKVNIKTGRANVIDKGASDTSSFILDENDQIFARVAADFKTNKSDSFNYYRIEVPDGNSWKVAFELSDVQMKRQGIPFSISGYSADKSEIYVTGGIGDDDKISLYAINLSTGQIEKAFSRPDVNISSLGRDPYTREFLGVSWVGEVIEHNYYVDGLQQLSDQLQAAFPHSVVSINSWDENYKKFIINVTGGTVANSYFLFDATTGQMSLIADQYPEVPGSEVAEVQYIKYTARDGLEIPAYVTYPKGRDPKNLPLIMLPHGGPEARDFPRFDFWPQMLANRGYVVMQPQFRGSSGFGTSFIRAGDKQWGRKMQTDLTDGVRHLVNQGIVDKDRVCIFGWSYGGYAALAGGTLDAETYRCTAAGAAVSDPAAMLKWVKTKGSRASLQYWTKVIGHIRDDKEKLKEISPVQNVAKIRGPLLLIHGENDETVPIEQSEIMEKAMKAAGKPYKFVRLKEEDHNITFGETRQQMMEALDEFMKENNPPY